MKTYRHGKRYLSAYSDLYGEPATKVPVTPRKRRAKAVQHEERQQMMLAKWLTLNRICFYHPANGGHRHPLEALKLKRMGVQPGVPDICIPLPRAHHHGLYIELKRPDGKLTDLSTAQKWWLEWLNRNGYCAKVAFGFDQAKTIVENYLKC